jgi:methylmalonyl-CoA/ethylmalonyl-CoA epimerase
MTEWQNERPEFAGGPLVVTTVGMAVADLYSTMAQYWETLGWGPWTVYRQEPPALTDMYYRGRPSEFSFLVAGTTAPGGTAFWLCQPLEGPSVYRDLVEAQVPGPHFMTAWRQNKTDADALRAWFSQRGALELMSARIEGAIEFVFHDATTLIGQVIETGYGRSTDQPVISTYP